MIFAENHLWNKRSLDRFRFLSNGKQFDFVNGSSSHSLNINSVVPRGSVLGPQLFLIYINDFSSSSSKLFFHLFTYVSNIDFEAENIDVLQK